MQIVIDIPESILNTIQADEMISREQLAVLQMHILNGTPLPKWHGRLIDEKDILDTENNDGGWYDLVDMPEYIAGIKPIIEADKTESEDKVCKDCYYNDGEVHAECVVCDKMTREEAISILSRPMTMKNVPSNILKAHEAAIKALEQEPCDDAISRQAAIDAIENEQKKIMRSDWAIDQAKFSAMSEIRALIADLPSVSTEKTGRWKRVSIDKYIQHAMAYYKCSECGGQTIGQTEYCPNCGAKMQEAKE